MQVRDGKIVDPAQIFFDERRNADVVVDCHGKLIVPGYIEVQINGTGEKREREEERERGGGKGGDREGEREREILCYTAAFLLWSLECCGGDMAYYPYCRCIWC